MDAAASFPSTVTYLLAPTDCYSFFLLPISLDSFVCSSLVCNGLMHNERRCLAMVDIVALVARHIRLPSFVAVTFRSWLPVRSTC